MVKLIEVGEVGCGKEGTLSIRNLKNCDVTFTLTFQTTGHLPSDLRRDQEIKGEKHVRAEKKGSEIKYWLEGAIGQTVNGMYDEVLARHLETNGKIAVNDAITEAVKAIKGSDIHKWENAHRAGFLLLGKRVYIQITPVRGDIEVPQILQSSYKFLVHYGLTINVLDKDDKEKF